MAQEVIIDIKLENLDAAKKGLKDLTKAQIEQQQEIQTTKNEIKEYQQELDALNELTERGIQIDDESIARQQELAEKLQTTKEVLSTQKDELADTNRERRTAVKEVELYNTAIDAEIGSNEQLRAQLKLLTTEYDTLSQEQRENTDEGQLMTTQIKGLTDQLKENESAVGDNRRNVGNYSEAIQDALGNITIMGTNLGGLVTGFKETKDATITAAKSLIITTSVTEAHTKATQAQTLTQKASTAAILAGKVALNIFKLALLATGIGAFVVILGSMVAFFKSTEKGAQQLKVVMAVLGSITDNLTSKMAEFGEIIFNAFSSIKDINMVDVFKSIGNAIKDNLLNRIEAFGLAGKAIVKIFSEDMLDGFKDLGNAVAQGFSGIEDPLGKLEEAGEKVVDLYGDAKEAVKEFTEEVKTDMEKAAALQERENNLVDERRRLLLENVELEKTVAEARIKAADKANLSQDEIIAKLEEAKEAESQKLANLTAIAKEEKEIAEGRSALATDSEAEAEELFQKKLAYEQALAAETQGTLRLDKQIASESYILLTETLAAELRLIKAQGGDQVAALIEIEEKKRDAQLEQTTLSATERLAIEAEAEKKIAKLRFDAVIERLDNENAAAELIALQDEKIYLEKLNKLDGNLKAQEELTEEYTRSKLVKAREAAQQELQVIQSEISDLEASITGGVGDATFDDKELEDLKKRLAEAGVEIAKIDGIIQNLGKTDFTGSLGDKLGMDEEQTEKLKAGFQFAMDSVGQIMATASEGLQRRTDERIAAVDAMVKSGVISEEEAEQKKVGIRKKAFEQQKKMDVASATMAYFEGLIQAIASNVELGFPLGLIVGGIQSAILTASYVNNIKNIKAQKFADGGMINGPSHSKGGVPFSVAGRGGFEAEGGEYIAKKKAVSHYGVPFMEAINNMTMPKLFAEGGYITPAPLNSLGSQVNQGLSNFAEANNINQIQVINVEEDFSKIQTRVNNVEQARTY